MYSISILLFQATASNDINSPQPSTSAQANKNSATSNGIEMANLSLSPAAKYEVKEKTVFRQYIRYSGAKLMLMTPTFHANELDMRTYDNGETYSVVIPIVPWLRIQLDKVEDFAQKNINIPESVSSQASEVLYKPLWPHERMCVSISKWRDFFVMNSETGLYENVSVKDTKFGPGNYSIAIEVPYIYIGSHKNGELYSLTIRAVQIFYQPEGVKCPTLTTVPIPFKAPEAKGRKKRKIADLSL